MCSYPPRQLVRHSEWRRLALTRRGVAALEFALTVPALIFLLLGMYDLSSGWITSRRLTTAAFSVGQIATIRAVQPDSTNALSYDEAWKASTAAYAAMPQMAVSGAVYAVALSEIVFSADSSCPGGSCVATVKWSALLLGVGQKRACGTMTVAPDTSAPDPTQLPADAFQPNPILVVDVTYTFTPLFLQSIIGTIPMRWMSYFPSRSGKNSVFGGTLDQVIKYDDPNNPGAQCS